MPDLDAIESRARRERRKRSEAESRRDSASKNRSTFLQESGDIDADGFNVLADTSILIVASISADSPWVGERVELPSADSSGSDCEIGRVIMDYGIDASQLRNQLFEYGTLVSVTKGEVLNGRINVRMEFRPGQRPNDEVPEKYSGLVKGILSKDYNKGELFALYKDGEQRAVRLNLEDTGNDCCGVHTPHLEDGIIFLR